MASMTLDDPAFQRAVTEALDAPPHDVVIGAVTYKYAETLADTWAVAARILRPSSLQQKYSCVTRHPRSQCSSRTPLDHLARGITISEHGRGAAGPDGGNSGNGRRSRTVLTGVGPVEIE